VTDAAAAVRGGRGSQPTRLQVTSRQSPRQRPPSAAAEDRNTLRVVNESRRPGSGRRPRRPRIATTTRRLMRQAGIRRSGRRPRRPRIATHSRGGHRHRDVRQRPPSAAAEDRNQFNQVKGKIRAQAAAAVRGGRGSQPHLAHVPGCRAAGQRPPSAAAEDRNLMAAESCSPAGRSQRPPSAAAEDRNSLAIRTRSRSSSSSGRRPRRPRIATLWRCSGL